MHLYEYIEEKIVQLKETRFQIIINRSTAGKETHLKNTISRERQMNI